MARLNAVTAASRPTTVKNVSIPPIAAAPAATAPAAIIGVNLSMKYTPALTIVAACIRALTGVGPVIAVTSHSWNGNCALFARAPSVKTSSVPASMPFAARAPIHASGEAASSGMLIVPAVSHIIAVPSRRPMSPILVNSTALTAL